MSYRIVWHRKGYAIAFGKPRVRRSLSTDDRGLAEARAKSYWAAMTAPKSDKVSDLWDIYLTDRKAEGVATANMDLAWKHLEPVFGYKLGNQVTKDDCRTYIKHRTKLGLASSSIRSELAYLRACLHLRYGRGSGAFSIQMPPASAPRERSLTKEEVATLLNHATTPHVRLFIILAITTGARMSAILEAKWDQVDFLTNTINYDPPGRNRSNKRRTVVPLNTRALQALKQAQAVAETDFVVEYGSEGIISVKKAIGRVALKAGVPCSPHVFRHTAGVWMAQADIPMQKIAQYLGHSTTAVTEHTYARYSPSFKKDAADALDW